MEYTYDIVLTPDPDNPNQQPAGSIIFDHRLYGKDAVSLSFSAQYYLADYFTKNINSSTLTAGFSMSWSVGQKVKISCNCTN